METLAYFVYEIDANHASQIERLLTLQTVCVIHAYLQENPLTSFMGPASGSLLR